MPGFAIGSLLRLVLSQRRRRRAAECRLRASEARFRACFEQCAEGMLVLRVEPDGRFVHEAANPIAESMLGCSADRIIRRGVDQVWPVAVQALMRDCVMRKASVTSAGLTDLGPPLPDGPRVLDVTIAPVLNRSGAVRQLIASLVDATRRNRQQLAHHQAQKIEAVGRLTAGIAHDFNNMLQAQAGSLELLLEEVADRPEAREYVEIALRSTRRGAQLTHHLLAFARKQVLQPRRLNVQQLLLESRDMLARTMGPQVEISVCTKDAPSAFADLRQLKIALLNLAMNARDAMPRGGQLKLEAYAAPGHGNGCVVLAVSDTGIGMDAATQEHACEPFFSTKGSLGSGLGLSMVEGFARQSGGDMRIVSAPGAGTRVEIWLPRADPPIALPVDPAVQPAIPRHAGRVLLVDDSPDVLLTTGAFLEGAGYQVVRADSGDRALVVLAAGERFDALVTDYAMPALNGAELILQALHLQPSLAALIITGFAEVAGIETLPHQVQLLRKPFRRDELARVLGDLVERARQADFSIVPPGCLPSARVPPD